MAITGNIQLLLANSAASDAGQLWKEHKRDCPKCSTAQRSRKPADMCGTGTRLYADRTATAADLARERKLARQPVPGQLTLDDL